ncbi:MAG TPA: L,D-transpeptidase [Xanthobacteraceae bacterium]|nr:L,D-transpeptidase [Xanthobacteraceae bacterium]
MLIGAVLAISFAVTAQAAIVVNIDKSEQLMTVAVDGATSGRSRPDGRVTTRRTAPSRSTAWTPTTCRRSGTTRHTMFFDMHGHAIHGFFDVKHLGSPVSHGCVRLAPANAATLFALVQGQGMSQTTVVVSGQAPARGGEEMARRRTPTQQVAAQPAQAAPPGYDYQPAPPQPYPAQAYGQPQTYYRQVQQPAYPPPPQGYYRQVPQPYYEQQQPYYAQQPPGYYPPQPPPVYVLRPPGLY